MSKGNKITIVKKYLPPMFTAALFIIATTCKQPKCLWTNATDKENPCTETNYSAKNKEILPLQQQGWTLRTLH